MPIAVLCGCALVAIVLILSGSGVDETSARILGTAATLAVSSLMLAACLSLARRRPALAAFGYLGVLAVTVALLFAVGMIWQLDEGNSDLARPAGISIVIAIACAHASLLLASVRVGETDAIRLVRIGTLAAMAVLATLLCVEIVSRGQEVSVRAIGVVAVLYLLGTLLLPLIAALARSSGPAAGPVAAGAGAPPALRVDQIGIAAADLERSNAFYRDVLGAGIVSADASQVAYRFAWPGPIAEANEHLRRHGVEIVAGPAPTQGTHGPAQGIAFRDPDGRLLELIAY